MSRYVPEEWRSQLRGPNGDDAEPDLPVGSDLAGEFDGIERDPGVIPDPPEAVQHLPRRDDCNTQTDEFDEWSARHYYDDTTGIPWRKRA